MTRRILGPGQLEPPPWPEAPAGWRWSRKGCPCQLEAPDGWKTANYNYAERALAEAQRRILSQPKPKEPSMTTQSFTVDQAAQVLRTAGYSVKPHGARWLVGKSAGTTEPLTRDELISKAHFEGFLSETPLSWTAECGQCGQSFISTTPVVDGALCSKCAARASSDAPAPAVLNTLPLGDLLITLETHASQLPKPLPRDYAIPLPAGIPARFDAPIDLVVASRYQPRTHFDEGELDDLAASIAEHGIQTAPIVFANEAGKLELVAGERRLRAARKLGMSFIPVDVRSYTLRTAFELAGVDNIQRAGLTDVEEGAYFNRLITELELSENELSKRLGKNRAYIQQRRAIATSTPALIEALGAGHITFSLARGIAQAAPGDHKAQHAALKQVQSWMSNGRKVSEIDARAETEKIIRKRLEESLKKLGWHITSWGEIWSESERPRTWTGAEMLEAVKTQRGPSATPIEGEASDLDLQVLQWQHDQVSHGCAPWIGLRKTYSGPWSYVSPSEASALAQTVLAAMSALQARVEPHGFTIDPGKSTYTRFDVKGQHVSQVHYSWAALEGCVAQIEAGELVDKPREQQAASSAVRPQQSGLKCDGCKKVAAGGLMYCGRSGSLCEVCRVPVLEQQKAEREAREAAAQAARQKADNAIGAWLRSAPAGAVPLVFAALVGDALDDEIDTETVLEAVGTYLRDLELEADDDEPLEQYAPNVAKLLASAGAPAEPAAEIEHQVDAEPLLLGDIPDDSPLAPIEAAVLNIHQWCKMFGAQASDEEIGVNLAELWAISNDLDGLSDDDRITDEQFEMLSTAIGKLATALRELREEKAVAV